jgi:hypothetical protein
MKKLLLTIATLSVLLVLIACNEKSSNSTPDIQKSTDAGAPITPPEPILLPNQETPIFEPQIDSGSINSYSDKENAIAEARQRKEDRITKAREEKETAINKLRTEFKAFEKAELMKVRESNYQAYVQWLESKQLDNYEKRLELERTVPELAQFRKSIDEHPYHKAREALETRYTTIRENAEKTYSLEREIADKAYKDSQQNKP